MNLLQKQQTFSQLAAKLLFKAKEMGFEVTMGETWRPDFTAKEYAKLGIGSTNSLHKDRLAIDLNLFDKNGKWLTKTEDYKALGEWWKAQSGEGYLCTWGGDFGDGNHFAISHGGRK